MSLKSEVRSASDVRHTTELTFVSDASVGDIVAIDSFIARAMHNVDVSEDAQGIGAYEIDRLIVTKATGTAWTAGDTVYFNTTSEEFTKLDTDTKAGVALADAASGATQGEIHLLGAKFFREPVSDRLADAGAHFADAEQNIEEAIQKLAKTIPITVPRFTGWTKDGTYVAVTPPALELPVAVRVKRAYAKVGTAPDQTGGLAIKLNGTALVTVAQAATTGEDETLDIAIAANTDFAFTVSEATSGAGANADLVLIAQVDDGE